MFRWPSQDPTNVATVAQVAAPKGSARSSLDVRGTPLRWTSQDPTKAASVAQVAAPQGAARSSLGVRMAVNNVYRPVPVAVIVSVYVWVA